MPYAAWSHPCHGGNGLYGSPTCRVCGGQGKFAEWRLSMHEDMARYQYVYGLRPVGPHRPLANRLFRGTRRGCNGCGGEGLRWRDQSAWAVCADCEGTGGFWALSPEEVERIRRRIVSEYPGAEASENAPHFLSGSVIQDLKSGEMLNIGSPPRGEEPGTSTMREMLLEARQPDDEEKGVAPKADPESPKDLEPVALQWWGYDDVGPAGILLRLTDWERLHLLHNAVGSATVENWTWRRFRNAIGTKEWEHLGLDVDLDAGFSADEVPGLLDGDYPPWLELALGGELPDVVIQAGGRRVYSMLGQVWHQFSFSQVEELRKALARCGYELAKVVTEGESEI